MIKDDPSVLGLRIWGREGKRRHYSLSLREVNRRRGKNELSFGHNEFEVPGRHPSEEVGS